MLKMARCLDGWSPCMDRKPWLWLTCLYNCRQSLTNIADGYSKLCAVVIPLSMMFYSWSYKEYRYCWQPTSVLISDNNNIQHGTSSVVYYTSHFCHIHPSTAEWTLSHQASGTSLKVAISLVHSVVYCLFMRGWLSIFFSQQRPFTTTV